MTKMRHRLEIHKAAPATSLAATAFSAAWCYNPDGKYDAKEESGRSIR